MNKKSTQLFVVSAALLLVGAGCAVPGEKSVINGNYLQQTQSNAVVAPTDVKTSAVIYGDPSSTSTQK